jgi:hypothetical protein
MPNVELEAHKESDDWYR